MSMHWTKEQKQVITSRDKNILVSAAAGSGKTAVLVERIIGRILDEKNPIDIDRMLIVTFTSAAAAEMRERIGEAIHAALEQNPDSSHLLRQTTLLHYAQITTIHSFCLNLIHTYFHQVDLEPNFRIAEEGERNLLQEDVIQEVLNQNYERGTEDFLQFVECFATGKKDDGLKDIILKLYHFAMSYPWPKEWLFHMRSHYQAKDFEELEQKEWMQSCVAYLKNMFQNLCQIAKDNIEIASKSDGPVYLLETVQADFLQTEHLRAAGTYRQMASALSENCFGRLPSSRGYEGSKEKLEQVKEQRNQIKDTIKKIKGDFFFAGEEEILKRISAMEPVAGELMRLTEEFMEAFDQKKREKNLLDFDDLEHFALKILIDEETKEPTEAALLSRKLYEEVMIDEYQDSNLVQESLLSVVSKEAEGVYNRFMVGDVKQSIYRFRQARPELFMEKYDSYSLEEEQNGQEELCAEEEQEERERLCTKEGQNERRKSCQKIELRKNFRSRREVLDVTNDIFYQIMKKDLGRIQYDASAALYPGAEYVACEGMEAELILADSGEELLEEAGLTDPVRLEAELVAARIRRMIREQKVTDKETKQLRPARYSDIVILLRSFGKYADTFTEVMEEKKIPAYAASKTGYFKTIEIQTILNLLKILDNPRQDIPLAAVLRSPVGGFSDEELALLKASGTKRAFHCCVLEPEEEKMPKELYFKLHSFLELISSYRELVTSLSIHELLYRILEDTGYARYAAAMPGGKRRKANIEMLLEKAAAYEKTSYRGLFHFIRYMDKLQKYEVDYGEADVVGENANAVRIMTIHKSKGLEFPIVFVCQTAKSFNRMDVRSRLVIHPDLGAALDYIDPLFRIQGATLYKKAVAKQIDLENLGEELRVLYVAFTRAKEKLVITGVEKEIAEKIEKIKRRRQEGGLSFFIRAGANSFLDWILPGMIAGGDEDLIQVWDVTNLVEEETESRIKEAEGFDRLLQQTVCEDKEADDYVEKQLSYQYPCQAETDRKTKYSVSELKHRAIEAVLEEEEREDGLFAKEVVIPYIPRFVGGETEVNRGALRGSAMHRAVECLSVMQLAGNESLDQALKIEIEKIVENGLMTEEMRSLLSLEKLKHFYQSPLAERMKAAAERGELHLEQPFVMGRPADEIEGDGSDTMVLIQGIIDAFFIEEQEIVLLDYKTDFVKKEEELICRYQKQLELYQTALEQNLGMKVKEKLMYSFCLEKTVLVE